MRASLASCFLQRSSGLVDILLFNPPYVPTDSVEALSGQDDGDISSAWAGGEDGMQITENLLRKVQVKLVATCKLWTLITSYSTYSLLPDASIL
jgi:release factor glutamine methyltransferase